MHVLGPDGCQVQVEQFFAAVQERRSCQVFDAVFVGIDVVVCDEHEYRRHVRHHALVILEACFSKFAALCFGFFQACEELVELHLPLVAAVFVRLVRYDRYPVRGIMHFFDIAGLE